MRATSRLTLTGCWERPPWGGLFGLTAVPRLPAIRDRVIVLNSREAIQRFRRNRFPCLAKKSLNKNPLLKSLINERGLGHVVGISSQFGFSLPRGRDGGGVAPSSLG